MTLSISTTAQQQQVGTRRFSQAASDRMRGKGLKLCHGRFRMEIRTNSSERVAKHQNGPARDVVRSSSLEIFKTHVYLVLRAVVQLTRWYLV